MAWVLSHGSHSVFFKLGWLLMAIGLVLTTQVKTKRSGWVVSLSILMWAYPLGELALYIKSTPRGATGFNRACAQPDSVRGYRWVERDIRYFKTAAGQLVFDNHFAVNKQGWVMREDYQYKKPDSLTNRWMLFGNSFSAGIMLETNLPNRLQELFDQDTAVNDEVYSFAVDGGGIMNWAQTFQHEVVPDYEFDGMIFCLFEDNLYRDLMVLQVTEETSYIGRIKPSEWDQLQSDWTKLENLDQSKLYWGDAEIQSAINHPHKPFSWPLKTQMLSLLKGSKSGSPQQRRAASNIDELQQKIGSDKFKLFEQMLEWCKIHGKQVVLASVPSRTGLMNRQSEKTWHQKEMELIAGHYQLPYFDGYEVFEGNSEEVVEHYWLYHDGHWNQAGSNLYAHGLFKFLGTLPAKVE